MKIGNYLKQSFIDWPGKISAVIFTQACNFRCNYCHNPSLVLPQLYEQPLSESDVLNFLFARKDWLEGVVITGGEPTMQSDLEVFLKEIKKMTLPVKLDTNGSNPLVLKHLIENRLLSFVSIDIKTILDPNRYHEVINVSNSHLIDKIRNSIDIVRESKIPYQLRTTLIPHLITNEIVASLNHEFGNNIVFQQYRSGLTIEEVLNRN